MSTILERLAARMIARWDDGTPVQVDPEVHEKIVALYADSITPAQLAAVERSLQRRRNRDG